MYWVNRIGWPGLTARIKTSLAIASNLSFIHGCTSETPWMDLNGLLAKPASWQFVSWTMLVSQFRRQHFPKRRYWREIFR
jgi:hypothetical protein